jgi:hypothetical protein
MNAVLEALKLWRMQRHARKAQKAVKKPGWADKVTPKTLKWMRENGAL